jgi:hypothetical protein
VKPRFITEEARWRAAAAGATLLSMSAANHSDEPVCSDPFPNAEVLSAYLGKWVALDDEGEVSGSGESFDEAHRQALNRGIREPEVFFVPEHAFAG